MLNCVFLGNSYKRSSRGFTLIELLVVIAIIGILSSVVLASLQGTKDEAHQAAAIRQIKNFTYAMQMYMQDKGGYPADVSRDVPSGVEKYLKSDAWPEAPWPGSVYDWDAWDINGDGEVETYQLSVRFCPLGDTDESNCNFPNTDWAQNFDYWSSAYWCFEGKCRAHVSKPASHPGYCLNCGGD